MKKYFAIPMYAALVLATYFGTKALTAPQIPVGNENPSSQASVNMSLAQVGSQIQVNADVSFQNLDSTSYLYVMLTVVNPDNDEDGWYEIVHQVSYPPFTVNPNGVYVNTFQDVTCNLPSGDYVVQLDLYKADATYDDNGNPLSTSTIIANDVGDFTIY